MTEHRIAAALRLCDELPNQWHYVTDADHLHGRDSGRYYLDPSLSRRPDADTIQTVLASRRMTAVTAAELAAISHNP